MCRLRVKASTTNLKKLILESISDLGMSIQDFCGITTNGAAVMCKLGRLLKRAAGATPFYHQQCLAHGLHLAVMDTLECHGASPSARMTSD